jgi:hypothetical protein
VTSVSAVRAAFGDAYFWDNTAKILYLRVVSAETTFGNVVSFADTMQFLFYFLLLLFVYLFICLFVYLFICLFVYMFICLFVYLFFVYLFICLYVYLFICLFVYLFIFVLFFCCFLVLFFISPSFLSPSFSLSFPL